MSKKVRQREQVAELLERVEALEGKARAAQCSIVQLQDAVLRLRRSLDEALTRQSSEHEHLGVRYKS
jgi:predicted  nucleic acid-binding Zn-ribbon protein